MTSSPLYLVCPVVALLACSSSDATRDASTSQICGANRVFGPSCGSRCPAPCACARLVWDPVPADFPELCAVACAHPWDCPSDQRCAYLSTQDGGVPICIPRKLTVSSSANYIGANVDCVFDPYIGHIGCKGDHVVQYQHLSLEGSISGCTTALVLQAHCPGGCAGGSCVGADAGAAPADAGQIACCPSGYSISPCVFTGGAKLPPRGCRMWCCDAGACSIRSYTDDFGCTVTEPLAVDAGPDVH